MRRRSAIPFPRQVSGPEQTRADVDRAVGIAVSTAVIRIGVGAAALVAPRLSARILFTDPARADASAVTVRMFGVRDLTLGMGVVGTATTPAVAGWVSAGALADAADVVTMLADDGATMRAVTRLLVTVGAVTATAGAVDALRILWSRGR